jgi:hypothetical protein
MYKTINKASKVPQNSIKALITYQETKYHFTACTPRVPPEVWKSKKKNNKFSIGLDIHSLSSEPGIERVGAVVTLAFWKHPVRNSVVLPDVMNKVSYGFPQSLQTNTEIRPSDRPKLTL